MGQKRRKLIEVRVTKYGPGIEPTSFGLVFSENPKVAGSNPGPYLVTRASINFILFRPIFEFGTEFYIFWANSYAQPQNFI